MNQETEELFQSIKQKIQALQDENRTLKNARDAYLREKDKDMELINSLKEEKQALAVQQQSSAVASSLDGNSAKMEKELKKYINMIDKCIDSIQSRL